MSDREAPITIRSRRRPRSWRRGAPARRADRMEDLLLGDGRSGPASPYVGFGVAWIQPIDVLDAVISGCLVCLGLFRLRPSPAHWQSRALARMAFRPGSLGARAWRSSSCQPGLPIGFPGSEQPPRQPRGRESLGPVAGRPALGSDLPLRPSLSGALALRLTAGAYSPTPPAAAAGPRTPTGSSRARRRRRRPCPFRAGP